jgi:hypothetical protein
MLHVIDSAARELAPLGLAAATGAAPAARGGTIKHGRQPLVRVGMTVEPERDALGPPTRTVPLRHDRNPDWIYDVAAGSNHVVFEVNFDDRGRVVRAAEPERSVE